MNESRFDTHQAGKALRVGSLCLALLFAVSLAAGLWDVRWISDRSLADVVISNWTGPSLLVARRMLEKYGAPEKVESSRLTWRGRGVWKQIVVWDEMPLYVSDQPLEVMAQTISYHVPAEAVGELEAFSANLVISYSDEELAVRSDCEETSFLVLNLADEIVRKSRTAAEARAFYNKTVMLAASGKSSPYLERLLFGPDSKR